MKYRPDKNQITWAMTLFFTCIALAVAIYLLFHLGPIFTWLKKVMDILQGVFYGIVIAYVLSPIVNLTEQKWLIPYYENKGVLFYAPENRTIRGRTRIISVVIAIFVATVMLTGLLGIVIPQLIQSITVLLNSVPSYLDNVNNWINQMQAVSDGNNEILNELQEYYNSISSELLNFINRQVMPNMNRIVQGLTDYLAGFISLIVNLFIGIIVSVYLLFSKEHFSGGAKKITYGIFREETANQIIADCRFIHKTFIGFLVGKIIDSIIIGLLCYIGTSILGTPYALLVSVLVGVTNIVPVFGPYIGAVIGSLFILIIQPIEAVKFVLFVLVLQQLDGNVIGPMILGGSTGLSSFWVLFSIVLFGGLFGIPGMILGVPLFACFHAAVRRFNDALLKSRNLPTDQYTYSRMAYLKNGRPVSFEESREETENGNPKEESADNTLGIRLVNLFKRIGSRNAETDAPADPPASAEPQAVTRNSPPAEQEKAEAGETEAAEDKKQAKPDRSHDSMA